MNARTILLNPGPVTLTERVRTAMLRPDICHREPEFSALAFDVRERIRAVYGATNHECVLLTGSGTCAVEAMLSSLAPNVSRTLIVSNGVYGERMAAMLEAHGKPFEHVQQDWLHGLDIEGIARRLADDPSLTHVATVHHETTTGRLNDIDALAEVCRLHGRRLLLDAVSSFGGEALDFGAWPLEGVAATANKCLHGVPGVAFVLARAESLDTPARVTSVYLDLRRYAREQRDGGSPFTQAVHACYALQEALRELKDAGGWPARRQRYLTISTRIREALPGRSLIACDESASMLTAFLLPQDVPYSVLHARLREAGFVIYAGQRGLADRIFRIAVMGDIGDDDVTRLLHVLNQ